SPAETLGEGEAYTALLIGANKVNQHNNCWLLTFEASTLLVVTSRIPCPLSPTLSHFTATRVGGEVYVFGGKETSDPLLCTNTLSVYTIASGEWRQIETQGLVPTARHGHTAFALGGCLYIGMGLPCDRKARLYPYDLKPSSKETQGGHQDFWCFDPAVGSWIQVDDPPYTGCYVASVVVGEIAHLFGGGSFHNSGFIEDGKSNFHLTYNLESGWTIEADTPFQSAMPCVFKVGTHIHV
ncbi:hypothetical protein KIPB_015577, partial [Kipferlia bialata]